MRRRDRFVAFGKWGAVAVGCLALSLHAQDVWSSAVQRNPQFAIGTFTFRTNGALDARTAASTAGLRPDMHLLDIDLDAVRERLAALPRVRRVAVERRLPDRLAIDIEERLPVAWLTCRAQHMDATQKLFIDAEGIVIRCAEMHRAYLQLPVIDAPDLASALPGKPIASDTVRRALELLELMRDRAWAEPASVRRIDIPNAWTMVVETDAGAVLTFAMDDLSGQLDRLQRILAVTDRRGREVASVNLQQRRNVPVTFVPEPVAVPAEAPAAPTTPVSASPARPRTAPDQQQRDIRTILRGR